MQNNEADEEIARRVQTIYSDVQRQVYFSGAAVVTTILLTSLYLIRSNRRLFGELAALSDARRDVAQKLITTRESTLGEIARELHDDLGQVLTALGLMVGRALKRAPPGSPLEADLREIGGIAQAALDNVRGLSQTLHPSILNDAGLEETIQWYLSTARRQGSPDVSYERLGTPWPVAGGVAIHVYRVLQESLTNVARHSGSRARLGSADVRARPRCRSKSRIAAAVSTRGRPRAGGGLGVVTMRERASLIGGSIAFVDAAEGGTLVRLVVPATSARGQVEGSEEFIESPEPFAREPAYGALSPARLSPCASRLTPRPRNPDATITVLLADDHPLVRRGFRRILEDDPAVVVVGEASDGDEAVRLAKSVRPQVVLIDYAMPGMNGVAATRAILRDAPDTKVVVLSMHSEDTLVRHAHRSGRARLRPEERDRARSRGRRQARRGRRGRARPAADARRRAQRRSPDRS